MVSFSGDAALSIGHYLRHLWQQFFGGGRAKATIAKAQSIDLSIQVMSRLCTLSRQLIVLWVVFNLDHAFLGTPFRAILGHYFIN